MIYKTFQNRPIRFRGNPWIWQFHRPLSVVVTSCSLIGGNKQLFCRHYFRAVDTEDRGKHQNPHLITFSGAKLFFQRKTGVVEKERLDEKSDKKLQKKEGVEPNK